MKNRNRDHDGVIELRRAPGVCCPDASCDNVIFHPDIDYQLTECKGCGKSCLDCPHHPKRVKFQKVSQ